MHASLQPATYTSLPSALTATPAGWSAEEMIADDDLGGGVDDQQMVILDGRVGHVHAPAGPRHRDRRSHHGPRDDPDRDALQQEVIRESSTKTFCAVRSITYARRPWA